ncbi:MAG TPA: glycoside hydrolase family 38 C-terminal domain-containing protein, partial [Solirubrobacteraceae bacterium]|nr:glycoside hydrolase family 38 C-terminal domain-containing protein [Solirubrobacteraceae bacterium]
MLPHRGHARDRIARAVERARARVHAERVPLEGLEIAGPVGRIAYDDAMRLGYRPAVPGEALGPLFATYWLRGTAVVPEAWAGARADLLLDTGGEATLWLGGAPVQGLNSGPRMLRASAAVVSDAAGGERVPFALELACNDLFGFGEAGQGAGASFALRACELARFDGGAWAEWHDLDVLAALERDPGVEPAWAGLLLAELHAYTLDGDRGRLARLLARPAGGMHRMTAIGHAHLDTAWLWPLEETWRKLVRTTTTQLRLMDDYPEHRFAHSQAQHYAWLAERSPSLFARVREAVARGQWIPVGAMWVEPDCNLPSGESLARQLLYGQRFFELELGRRCTELWLPDVFGYAAQLPQLMRLAGVDRFLTQKLSWNRFTSPESHTFTWQGLDGSEVLTHFPPADTYNAEATVPELRAAAADYKDHPRSRRSLLVFGHGDGGGGPTAEMLERLRRAGDLAGMPPVALDTPAAFFDDLAAEAQDLRTVVGELYFEYHRGTYTSQAAVKRGNRRGERGLQDAELLDALLGDGTGKPELDRLWRVLLLNQFHDILPGSSITEVYERARADLAAVAAGADAVAARALGPPGEVPVAVGGPARREVVTRPDGRLALAELPACGAGRLVDPDEAVTARRGDDGAVVLENAHLRAVVGADGALHSLRHRVTGREALAAPGNVLELYTDDPVAWDAWDIDPAHLEQGAPVPPAAGPAELREHPLRAEVVIEREVGERSRLRQSTRLDAGARRLEFHTEVDWQEDHALLKAAFPFAVHADEATYEVAFGAVRRPTHFSTDRDLARYEVPGHRWADIGEHGFGAALLTDSTYGYSARGSTLRLSL